MLAAGAALLSPGLAGPVQADAGVSAGVLICDEVPGTRTHLLIHSSVQLDCVFDTPRGKEHYKGTTGVGLGVDLTFKREANLVFSVLMASTDVDIGAYALAGKYFGGGFSAAFGPGAGAHALIGGGPKNVSLEPLAFETSTGLGVDGGLTYLFLEPAPAARTAG